MSDGEWVVVQKKSSAKAEARRAEEKQRSEEAKKARQERERLEGSLPMKKKKPQDKKAGGSGGGGGGGGGGGAKKGNDAPKPKKKKEDPDGPRLKRPSNRAEMLDLLAKILDDYSDPNFTVSSLGNRLQQLFNTPWNKAFKPTYGPLSALLATDDRFVLKGDVVVLADYKDPYLAYKEEHDRIQRERRAAEEEADRLRSRKALDQQKKKQKRAGGGGDDDDEVKEGDAPRARKDQQQSQQQQQSKHSKQQLQADSHEGGASSFLKGLAALALLGAVVYVTIISVTGNPNPLAAFRK